MKATEKMMSNGNPRLTNKEVFWEEFEKLTILMVIPITREI